jgi:hypothetical protein
VNPTHSIHQDVIIAASADAIWARLADYEQTHTWVTPLRVRVLESAPDGGRGVGTKREVTFPGKLLWGPLTEGVVTFEPPSKFEYAILKGLPGLRAHKGSLSIEALEPRRSKLTWHIDFEFPAWHPVGWFAGVFIRTFGQIARGALDELARQLASAQEPNPPEVTSTSRSSTNTTT